jgi:hypothetical protein
MFRKPIVSVIVLLAVLAVCWPQTALADKFDAAQIKAVLRTATPKEDKFVERVVAKVNAGKFPADLFASTLQAARKKTKNRFQYFKRALILRAADAGVSLKGCE